MAEPVDVRNYTKELNERRARDKLRKQEINFDSRPDIFDPRKKRSGLLGRVSLDNALQQQLWMRPKR